MMEKRFYVYILASKRNGTLYLGITSDIVKRTWQHKNDVVEGFTKKYGLKKLVYYGAPRVNPWFQLHDPPSHKASAGSSAPASRATSAEADDKSTPLRINAGFPAKADEIYKDAESAIKREKQLKKWRRAWKLELIEKKNPEWRDLYPDICQ